MVYRHLVYDNTSRNDSAMDLSRNDRYHNTRSDLDDSPRVIPPSAEPSGSLPWSQFNTRLGSDYATTNDNFGDLTATYQGLNTYSPASLDVFDSYIPDPSGLRCSTPGIDSPTDLSVPPSPPSPPSIQQWASSSMATPSSILFHRTHRDNDFIGCDQCSTRFTGRHRNGNRGRHMRLKHSKDAVIEYRCLAEECNKTFQRTDARLKHVRNSHPALLQASPQYKHDIAARWEVPTGSVLPFNPPSLIAPPVTPRLASGALVAKKALNELDYICSYTQQEQEDQATGAEFGIAGAPEDRPYIFTAGCINDATPHIDPYLLDLSSTTARGGSYSLETTKTPSSGLEDILRGVLSQLDLDQPTYSRAWVAFFTRWGYVLQELLDKRSDAYPLFAKVIEDIHTAFVNVNFDSYMRCGPKFSAPQSERAAPRGGKGKQAPSPNATGPSHPGRISKHTEQHKLNVGHLGSCPLTTTQEDVEHPANLVVDCPIYKHHLMHGTTGPCHGCRVTFMAQLRGHLNPSRAGTHKVEDVPFPSFLSQCPRCKVDFIDRDAHAAHVSTGTCVSIPQSRGDIVKPWIRLYLTLYPNATRVPEPWPDHQGWLPETLVQPCRPLSPASPATHSFLGQCRSTELSQATMSSTARATNQSTYNAAFNFVVREFVSPMFIQPSPSLSAVPNPDRTSHMNNLLNMPGASDAEPNNPTSFDGLLTSMGEFQRNLVRSAASLTQEQIQFLADQCHEMSNIGRTYAIRQSLQGSDRTRHEQNESQFESPSPEVAPAAAHNVAAISMPNVSSLQTPSSSTHPGSHNYWTGSSQQPSSTFTPFTPVSSLQNPSNPQYLAANSPLLQRSLSRSSELTPERSRLRAARPSRLSLPERNGPQSPFMNPSADQTPDEDFEDYLLLSSSKPRGYFGS